MQTFTFSYHMKSNSEVMGRFRVFQFIFCLSKHCSKGLSVCTQMILRSEATHAEWLSFFFSETFLRFAKSNLLKLKVQVQFESGRNTRCRTITKPFVQVCLVWRRLQKGTAERKQPNQISSFDSLSFFFIFISLWNAVWPLSSVWLLF